MGKMIDIKDLYVELLKIRKLQESSSLNKNYSKMIEVINFSNLAAMKSKFIGLGVNLESYLDRFANSSGAIELTLVSSFEIGTDVTKDSTRIDMVLKFTNKENNSETIMTHAVGAWVNRNVLTFVI